MELGRLDLSVRIGGLVMANPVGVASGTFGYGGEYERLMDLDSLGALYTKVVTPEPRPGNPPPRLAETPSGMLNTIGLANPGLEGFIKAKLPELEGFSCARIVNVAGSTEEDYLRVIEGLDGFRAVDGFELNLSCPNVKHGGLSFGTDPVQVERITSRVRAMTAKPLIVKLTPNVTDICAIARAAEAGGADAVSCINTLLGMAIDVGARRPVLSMKTGGLSGPAVKPVGIAAVYRVSRAVSIPVIGLGGIMCARDALEYLLAGAQAIQVGTGTFVDPGIPLAVLEGIKEWMEENSVTRVTDIRTMLRE